MLLRELKEIGSVEQVNKLMSDLSKATSKYRALRTPAALKNLQNAEERIQKALGQK